MTEEKIDPSVKRIVEGTSWAEFCDGLKAAGETILGEEGASDAFNRAEGFRYLSRLTRAALETFVENADPQAPELVRTCNETVKMGADNPDNYYQNAPISEKYRYRIRGTRGTVHYLGFGTQAGNYGATGNLAPTGYLDDSKLVVDEDGGFEIIVSQERPEGEGVNWLPMGEGSRTLVIRQTFLDRETEERAEIELTRVDGAHAPRYVSPRSIDRGLVASARFVEGCARLFNQWSAGFAAHENELPLFDSGAADDAGGVPHIAYYHSYWRLAEGEALVIEVTPPDCDYWNFQLNNHWLESLDYRYFPVVVNKHGAKLEEDGSVRIIIAREDPGVGNWIDTAGHDYGTMCLRWVRAEEHPTPSTRVVKLEELRQEGAR